jgi:hypothetical protein
LIARHGEKFDPGGKVELFQSNPGAVMKSPWAWKRYGQCGKWVSDLVPHIGSCADDLAFIHSMTSKSSVHGPATFMQNSGFVLRDFPAWARGCHTDSARSPIICRRSSSCRTPAVLRRTDRAIGLAAFCQQRIKAQ